LPSLGASGKDTFVLLVLISLACVGVIVVVSPSKTSPALVPKSLLKAVFFVKASSLPVCKAVISFEFVVICAKSADVENLFTPSGISSVFSKLACLKVPLT